MMKHLTMNVIMVVIGILLLSVPAAALCQVEFVNYRGSCPEGGDLRVIDSRGEVLIEQFYTVNKGCYQGEYHIAVPGGSGDECRIQSGDIIFFHVNGITMGSATWSGVEKIVTLDLVRPSYHEIRGKSISPTVLYFVLTVMALLVVLISILQFYRRRR